MDLSISGQKEVVRRLGDERQLVGEKAKSHRYDRVSFSHEERGLQRDTYASIPTQLDNVLAIRGFERVCDRPNDLPQREIAATLHLEEIPSDLESAQPVSSLRYADVVPPNCGRPPALHQEPRLQLNIPKNKASVRVVPAVRRIFADRRVVATSIGMKTSPYLGLFTARRR